MLIIEHEFFAEEAEFDDLIHPELLPECLVLLPEIPVFQELFHSKVIAVLRIDNAVAIIADVVPFDLPRKQPLYLAAADGARGSFIKQAHYKILLSHIFRGAAPFDHSISGNRARYKEKSVNFPGVNACRLPQQVGDILCGGIPQDGTIRQQDMAIDMAAVDRIPGDDLVRDLISRPDLKVAIKDDSDEKIKLVFLQTADDPQLPALRGGKIGALPAALYLIAQAIAPGGIQPTGGVFLQAKAQLLRNQPFRKIPYGAIVGADDPALVQGDKHRSVLVHQGQDLLHFGILHGYRLLSPLPYHFGARP